MRPNVSRPSSPISFRKPHAPRLSLLAALIVALAWPAWAQNKNSGGQVKQDSNLDYIYVGNAPSASRVIMVSTENEYGGGTVDLIHVYGGRGNDQWVVDNSVKVNWIPNMSFQLSGNLFGGSTDRGHAVENKVFMNTGLVKGSVYGNHTEEGDALGDGTANVTLTGLAAVVDDVYGGWMNGRLGSSDNNQRIASRNYVRLEKQAGVGVTRSTNNDGGNVYGGYSANQYKDATADAVTYNTVVLAENAQVSKGNNTSPNGHVFGGWAAKGNVAYNKVRIEGGGTPGTGGVLVEGDVTANHAADGSATGSGDLGQPDVYIEAGKVSGDVIGGNSRSTAPVTDHVVEIAGGEIGGNIYGGLGNGGSIQDNTIVLAGEADLDGSILYGHFGGSTTGSQNNTLRVEVKNEQVQAVQNFDTWHFALPGDLQPSNDPDNPTDIMLKATNQGGFLNIVGERVTVSTDGGNLDLGVGDRAVLLSLVHGAINYTAPSTPEQTAWLDGVSKSLPALVYYLDVFSSNRLDIALEEKYLYGSGGTNTPGQREQGNTLTLTGGNATAAFGGRSNKVNAVVSGNTAKMSGGELVQLGTAHTHYRISGNLYGGYADEGSATGNTVKFSGGKAFEVTGGEGIKGSATGNTVTISGSAEVMGTYVRGGAGGFGDATGNTVTLAGGTFSAANTEVYGGFVRGGTGYAATGNTVILGANLGKDALQNAQIYGGNTPARVTGNTLSVEGAGLTVGSINNFENLHFILPAATAAGATMLKVTGGVPTFFAQMTNIGVAIAGGGSVLKMGDQVTLLTNTAGLTNGSGGILQQGTDYQQVNLTGRQGISLDYGFALDNDANSIFAQVTAVPKPKPTPQPQPDPKPQPTPPQPQPEPQPQPGPQVNPQTKAIPEGRVAGMGMLNLGADQIVRMTGNLPNRTGGGAPNFGGSADGKGAGANGAPSDTTAFARLSGYDQKVMTGSHVKVNGASAIVGAAKVLPLAGGGTAAVGAFFEYGDGSFKTHNGFDTGDVNGKGNSDYYGAGVLARVNLAGKESADGGGAPFVEGSVHAGRIHNNWHTDDLRDAATGARAQYDIRTPYMGGHVGAGYRWQADANTQVEVFGQYLYTHMDGKETTVALDPYSFRAVKSSRTRIGAKGTWAVSQQTQAYAGAAWEREFDGTARATAYSFDVPAPTMKGNSAVIDAGLSFQPKRNLSTNVGVTGYAGKRRGASANVEVQYLF